MIAAANPRAGAVTATWKVDAPSPTASVTPVPPAAAPALSIA